MQIKRLELQGFKSFKDKTVINFDDGITGIVGPNGCGKSNVVDAFFWVMGEQNARHLRGQSMDDLIFSGSDKSPAGSFAEVTLVLEMPMELAGPNVPAGASSADPAVAGPVRDVAITRKLYRTGESDYFINKTPCRLRDIQELFMDTGVGARGYSIIQQGQIAKLVQAKPEDRRTMIEEVAGVVKYKARRKESMRKLEGTQQNLLRVTDVINELETQKRQMERQAEKARKYKEWKEKLQSIELHFNALKWEELVGRLGILERDIDALNSDDTAISTSRETMENQISAKRIEVAQATNISDELQRKWIAAGQELNNAENELKYSTKNLEDLRTSSAQLEKDAEAEASLVEELRAEYERLNLESATILETHAEAEAARQAAESAANAKKQEGEALERTNNQGRNQLMNLSTELEKARNQANLARMRLEELSGNLERLAAEKIERSELLAEATANRENASSLLATAKAELEAMRATLDSSLEETRTQQRALEEERRNSARLHSEQARINATLNTLEEQKRRHEASSKGVKNVFQEILKKNEAWKSSVSGTLSEFLEVDKGFETATEAALGRALDLILTSDSATHKEISQALKSQSMGRASFANLAALKALGSSNDVSPTGLTALAAHVRIVASDKAPDAAGLLKYLLQKIYVVDSLNSAEQLSAEHKEFSFVTTDGEILRGGWFLEGGDRSSVSGAQVGRNREITELSEALAKAQSELAASQERIQAIEASLQEMDSAKRTLEATLREKQSSFSQLSSEEASTSARLREAERSLQQLDGDLQRAEQEQARFSSQESEASEKASELGEEKALLEITVSEAAEQLQAVRAGMDELQQTFMDARIRAASVTEMKNTIQSRLRTAEASLSQHAARVETMIEQAKRKQSDAISTNERIDDLNVSMAMLREELVTSEQLYREARDRLDLINNEVEVLRSASQDQSSKEREIKEQLMKKSLELQRLVGERDNLAQNTFERYGITLGEYAMLPETQEQVQLLRDAGEAIISETQNEVLLLREKIRKLGEVNPNAVDEYDQIVDRYNFLSTQKADLERSMKDLADTIEKINKVSKDRFERAFAEVNAHFMRVFPVIFGGGHAHLTLTNPEDMLETGVDITAQPPGKKAQNINLLSGGEKTLTAISLLFAVFLVKPSPFCLLDEVDAPLDDANIGRFNALLREMSKRSQFIIITHNKRTMELNDKLYGVTMEDAGVSKMVSIQLSAGA